MRLDEALDDGKSEAGALVGRGDVVPALAEILEHPLLIVGRNSHARIGNAETYAAVGSGACEDRHDTALRCEFYRVGEEVEENLLDRALVAIDQRQVCLHLLAELAAGRLCARAHHGAGVHDGGAQIEVALVESPAPGLDLGEVENVVD